MKKINVGFEPDESLEGIEIVVRASERDAEVDALIDKLLKDAPHRLTVLDGKDCSCMIDESNIIYVASNGKQVRVVTAKGDYRAKQTLQGIEELLDDRLFLRISRFEIINLSKVNKYDFTIAGTLRIEFEGGTQTWASRRYIPIIKEKLSQEEGYLC